MEYTALYRQWRPDTLDEVVGQDHVVRILKNQIKTGMISHAYLFSGPRGTGKTSTAKIFAKAINCTDPVDGNPCGHCEVCKIIDSENNMDILEIDAASNTGVDHIREIRDNVKYPPSAGRYRVYIIDEVHMLSTSAFNAFLKTLEEPPDHIVFILATTEPHKLPSTILSRCQRYDFRRITLETIVNRLKVIAHHMGIDVEEEALEIIARWSEGGMRDSISLLDQCISFCGPTIKEEDVLAILGTAGSGFLFNMVDNIIEGDLQAIFLQIDHLVNEGRDIQVFLKDLINHIRNLLIADICSDPAVLLDVSENSLERYKEQAARADRSRLIRAIEILTKVDGEIKWSTKPRIMLEMAMVKICRPQDGDSLEDLRDRIAVLERLIEEGVPQRQAAGVMDYKDYPSAYTEAPYMGTEKIEDENREDTSGKVPEKEIAPRTPGKAKGDKSSKEGSKSESKHKDGEIPAPKTAKVTDIDKVWSDILKIIRKDRMAIYTLLRDTKLQIGGKGKNRANLIFPSHQGFYMAAIEKEENTLYIEGLIGEALGQELKLKCYTEENIPDFSSGTLNVKEPMDEEEPESHEDNHEAPDIVQKAIDIFGEEYVEVIED